MTDQMKLNRILSKKMKNLITSRKWFEIIIAKDIEDKKQPLTRIERLLYNIGFKKIVLRKLCDNYIPWSGKKERKR